MFRGKYIGKGQMFVPEQKGMGERVVNIGEKDFELNQEIDFNFVSHKDYVILTPEGSGKADDGKAAAKKTKK